MATVRLLTVSFMIVVGGCASTSEFIPGGFSNESLEDTPYAYRLELFEESPLVPIRGTEVYRLFLTIPGEHTSVVRIEYSDGSAMIIGKLAGAGRKRVSVSRALSDEEWRSFLLKVVQTEFWLGDTYQAKNYAASLEVRLGLRERQGGTYGGDFDEWFIEASNGTLYHVSSARSPREGPVYDLAMMMLELSGIQESWL